MLQGPGDMGPSDRSVQPLTMRDSGGPRRPAVAWLLPGDDPKAWLNELCRWGVPLGSVWLHPIAGGPSDRRLIGVLASVATDASPRVSPRVRPYGQIAGRLYLPVEAVLDPPATEEEIARLLPDAAALVWHPAAGLVRFDSGERLRIAHLLEPPPFRESLWDAADPGIVFARRLTAVEPDHVPSLAQILEEGRGDIATEPPTLDNLPPAPGEPRRGLGRLRQWLRGLGKDRGAGAGSRERQGRTADAGGSGAGGGPGLLGGMLGLVAMAALRFASRASPTAASRTWINGLEDWANGVLQRIAAANPFARMREVQRLLHLLDVDPSEGLRHAIPFGSGESQRGVAPPSNRLGTRSIDFNMGRLSQGGPADFWDLPNEYRLRLQEKYRELAIRETSLGRHRRAAFIYAELLGDYAAAAAVLAAGRHFREAAVLYREKLHHPLAAARCLEQGGLLVEAAALFEELGEFEPAGDVHRRLDDEESACRCYEAAVQTLIGKPDLMAAAGVVERKLKRAERALDVLRSGWPGPQGPACLSEWFAVCGRHALHEAASRQVVAFRRDLIEARLAAPVAETLSRAATGYPDRGVAELAERATRVIAARRLESCEPAEARRLVAAVSQLAPHDRLLTRDGERCLREAEKRHQAQTAARGKTPPILRSAAARGIRSVTMKPVRLIPLSPHVEWQTAAAAGPTFYAAGYRGDMLVVTRGYWDVGNLEPPSVTWRPIRHPGAPVWLAPDPRDAQPLLVHVPGESPLIDRAFAPMNRDPRPLPAGSPPWINRATVAMARDPSGTAWSLDWPGRERFELHSSHSDQSPASFEAIALPVDWVDGPEATPRLWAGDRARYVAVGVLLRPAWPNTSVDWIELPDVVQSLCGAPLHTRPRVAATFGSGGVVVWGPDLNHRVRPFAEGMDSPRACFTAGGWLVAANDREIRVFRAEDGRIEPMGQTTVDDGRVLAVLPTASFGQFGIVAVGSSRHGPNSVVVWQIS